MNNRVVIQISIDTETKNKATAMAKEMGFSSLQEVIRVFLTQFARDKKFAARFAAQALNHRES